MSDRILIGGIPPEGEVIIQEYLDKYLPNAQIENLKSIGIKGKVKNTVPKLDVVFAIIDESLYDICASEPSCVPVLELPKVHRFVGIPELKEFLISNFGEDITTKDKLVLPDELEQDTSTTFPEEDVYISPTTDFGGFSEKVPLPDEAQKESIVNNAMPSFSGANEETNDKDISELTKKIEDLQSTLESKESIIKKLEEQVNANPNTSADALELNLRINELESDLINARKELAEKSKGTVSFSDIGKIAWAEQIIGQVDELEQKVKTLTTKIEGLEEEKVALKDKADGLSIEVTKKIEIITALKDKNEDLSNQITNALTKVDTVTKEKDSVIEEKLAVIESQENVIEEDKVKIETLSNNLNDLQVKFDSADAEIQVLQEKINTLNGVSEELQSVKAQLGEKSDEVATLTQTIANNETTVTELNNQITALQNEVKTKEEQLETTKQELTTVTDTNKDTVDTLNNEKVKLTEELSTLKQTITDLTEKLNKVESERDKNITLVTTAETEKKQLNQQITTLNDTISTLRVEIETKESESKAALEELTKTKDAEIENLQESIRDLRDNFNGDKEQIVSNMQAELDTLRETSAGKLKELNEQLEKVQTDHRAVLIQKDELIADKDNKIDLLESELAKTKSELDLINKKASNLEEQLKESATTIDLQNSSSEELSNSNNTLVTQLETVTRKKSELETKIDELTNTISELESKNSTMQQELTNVKSELANKETQITSLTNTVDSNTDTTEEISKLNNALLTEQRTVAQLRAELSTTKTQAETKLNDLRSELDNQKETLKDKTTECATLQKSVTELNSKINELELQAASRPTMADVDIADMQNEIVSSRAKIIDLQTQLAEKDVEVSDINTSIFGQLANSALPTSVVNANIDITIPQGLNTICIASASPESTDKMYKAIKDTCTASQKRCLILDLTTNSTIDTHFRIKTIESPVKWLVGTEPFQKFIANTSIPNVKVISLALTYMNELSLLQINWSKRLAELNGFADIVVINVGCLNNTVSKVLFNSFIKKMPSYAFVKATPVNIRMAIINLNSSADAKNFTRILCLDYTSDSKDIYARLAQQYKADIIPINKPVPLF